MSAVVECLRCGAEIEFETDVVGSLWCSICGMGWNRENTDMPMLYWVEFEADQVGLTGTWADVPDGALAVFGDEIIE